MDTNINAVILNCNATEAEQFCKLIGTHYPNIIIRGCFDTLELGRAGIDVLNPDILFVDMDYCKGDVFGFIERKIERDFEVVVIGKLEQLNMMKKMLNRSVEYIENPIQIKYLDQVIENVLHNIELKRLARIGKVIDKADLEIFKQFVNSKISIPLLNNITVAEVQDVEKIISDNESVTFYFNKEIIGSSKEVGTNYWRLVSSKSIGEWEESLKVYGILRIHNKHLVNLLCIQNIVKGKTPGVLLKGDTKNSVQASATYKEALMKYFI